MAAEAVPSPSDAAALDALKRIKATEAEWDDRLRTAHRTTEEALARRRAEADAAVKAVAAEAEAERTRAVARAREGAESEARGIVAAGEAAARDAAADTGKRPLEMADQIIAAVVGPLAPD